MLPQTHHFIIEEAIRRAQSWFVEFGREILQGNDDEDVHIVPMVHWRLRAAGLTHTHVPRGHRGELFFPSAKHMCSVFLDKAIQEKTHLRKAIWIGRACHLLGDVAVPARARRVWHLEGDPLEEWIDTHLEALRSVPIPDMSPSNPDEIIENLARLANSFPATTTRTPWGRVLYHWFGRGNLLDDFEYENQARILIPSAIAATTTLLNWVDRSC